MRIWRHEAHAAIAWVSFWKHNRIGAWKYPTLRYIYLLYCIFDVKCWLVNVVGCEVSNYLYTIGHSNYSYTCPAHVRYVNYSLITPNYSFITLNYPSCFTIPTRQYIQPGGATFIHVARYTWNRCHPKILRWGHRHCCRWDLQITN